MTLSVNSGFQFGSPTDGDANTTTSQTPTNGAFYLVGILARTGDAAARVPVGLTGTNGWNTTWTEITGARIAYQFTSIDRGHWNVFYGIAASGTAGTLSVDYGAGADYLNFAWHAIRIGGNVNTTSPVGQTVTAQRGTADRNFLNATFATKPARNSAVLVFAGGDYNSATVTPLLGYSTVTTVAPVPGGWTVSYVQATIAPVHQSIGSYYANANATNDIMAIAGIEIMDLTPDYEMVNTGVVR